jgi:uncharacterized protein YndB with AHSA1/START domain
MTDGNELVITRTFDAPVALVWRAWSEPEHYSKWFGPKGMSVPHCTIDFRVGGKYLYCMKGPDFESWFTGVYKEITPVTKTVATVSMADAQGNVLDPSTMPGMPPDWPIEMLLELTFEDMGDKTRMTLRHIGMPAGHEMASVGYNEAFDKLAQSLRD